MKLEIFDTDGAKIEINDLVQVQEKRNGTLTFFARVQLINGKMWPFDQFAYDRIIKVNQLSKDAKHIPAKDGNPEYWMDPKVELKLIEEDRLQEWLFDKLQFTHSLINFYKITA